MSDRKRERLGRCIMCRRAAVIIKHGKCLDCRAALMYDRYAMRGKLHKFKSKGCR